MFSASSLLRQGHFPVHAKQLALGDTWGAHQKLEGTPGALSLAKSESQRNNLKTEASA